MFSGIGINDTGGAKDMEVDGDGEEDGGDGKVVEEEEERGGEKGEDGEWEDEVQVLGRDH